MLENYINGDYADEGFSLEKDLNEEKMKNLKEEDIDDYIENLLITAKNFGTIFRKKVPRRRKIKKLAK